MPKATTVKREISPAKRAKYGGLTSTLSASAALQRHILASFVGRFFEELKDDIQHKGMYVDFGELKKDLRDLADSMDHALIIEKNSLKETTLEALKSENFRIIELDFRPTAENMAKYFYEKIKKLGYNMKAVTVYETPVNSATYME